MTVIAWDGKTIASDKRGVCGNMTFTTSKLKRLPNGVVLGYTGSQDAGEWLCQWFIEGADKSKWPKCQDDKIRGVG